MANATAAPPTTTHCALPVIIACAAPALLELLVAELEVCVCAVPLPVPVELMVLARDVFPPSLVLDAVAVPLVVEAGIADEVVDPAAEAEPVLSNSKLEIVTGKYVISLDSRVVVVIPGLSASSPPYDAVHTPAVAGEPVRVQSI
jgi:hypothetical protein